MISNPPLGAHPPTTLEYLALHPITSVEALKPLVHQLVTMLKQLRRCQLAHFDICEGNIGSVGIVPFLEGMLPTLIEP